MKGYSKADEDYLSVEVGDETYQLHHGYDAEKIKKIMRTYRLCASMTRVPKAIWMKNKTGLSALIIAGIINGIISMYGLWYATPLVFAMAYIIYLHKGKDMLKCAYGLHDKQLLSIIRGK